MAARKLLVGGLVLLCCALVVLTAVATSSKRVMRTALKQKGDPWESQWGWYSKAPKNSEVGLVASHMKQFNSRELYQPLGTFNFDQGVPRLAGGQGIYYG
mmetsp:Transcript_84848/g.226394  ORF Transcript_84848/g.226394 Transcript_84848/m.226394 type:complete len:100 (+) Transcript_84848:28-327(+)